MSIKITSKGRDNCNHKMVYQGKKKTITVTPVRCTECGQEEEHTEERER